MPLLSLFSHAAAMMAATRRCRDAIRVAAMMLFAAAIRHDATIFRQRMPPMMLMMPLRLLLSALLLR